MPPDDVTTDYDPQTELDSALHESETETETEEESLSDFEALVAARYGPAPEEEVSGPSEPVEQQGEIPEGGETAPPVTLDEWEIEPGVKLSRETAISYLQFEQFLEDNPGVAEIIQRAVVGEQAQTPASSASPEPGPQLPEELDLDNPAVKYLVDSLTETRHQYAQAMEMIQRHEAQLSTQTEATTESIVNRASASFAQERGLTEDQMNSLKRTAANMNVMEGLLSPIDPISGLPRRVDPLAAVEKALDIAYWSIPEYRDKEISRQQEVSRLDAEKKRKLTSLGGSSGSTPREMPQPQTKQEIQQAMIREVAEAIGVPPSQ